jgi:hypothetical protein
MQMTENEKFAAMMATLRAVVVDLGAIKASLAIRDDPQTGRLDDSTRISTFAYSSELRVSSSYILNLIPINLLTPWAWDVCRLSCEIAPEKSCCFLTWMRMLTTQPRIHCIEPFL